MRYYNSRDIIDDSRTLDDAYTFDDSASAYLFFEYLFGITGKILANKMVVLDKHLTQKGELDYSLVVDPLVIQDATTGEDTLHFSYPAEHDERLVNTLRPFLDWTLTEVDAI